MTMKRSILVLAGLCAMCATAAVAATSTFGRPWTTVYVTETGYDPRVDKVCDHGRALYVGIGTGYQAGVSVAVVENAPECQF